MPGRASFFSLAELKQPVNQWLCIAFMSVLCFWVVMYYFTQTAEAIGGTYASESVLPAAVSSSTPHSMAHHKAAR